MSPASAPLLLIFDCDGVLVDSEPIASRTLAAMLTETGFPLTAEEAIERYTGISLRAVLALIESEWGRPLPPDFAARLRERDRAAFDAELQAMPGVIELLGSLSWPVCVASSGTPDKIRANLAVTGLLPFFEPHLFSAEMVERGKPAPDLFLYAAREMGVSPERCVVVEDSVAGVRAARAAAMEVFGFCGGGHVRPGFAGTLLTAGATRVFTRMGELRGPIEELARR
ncbi:HAD family phosphatase [Accumulibacter sp.]|uniref:HAD family hydrolase n=1 Tax=Accumulibacter sp. TaxID=2053492 RepID=UPI0025F82EE9|nr:HAD family hydrolase [Accumulibacter sp.]MCM8595353.1 HAD family hydrolase [Accumulibacter sp.]MCM8625304.1 HAD family hydrolase [Accumulibacter sp.]MDS4049500.1 HAD family hydrolase [Accumulibacter sp.]